MVGMFAGVGNSEYVTEAAEENFTWGEIDTMYWSQGEALRRGGGPGAFLPEECWNFALFSCHCVHCG